MQQPNKQEFPYEERNKKNHKYKSTTKNKTNNSLHKSTRLKDMSSLLCLLTFYQVSKCIQLYDSMHFNKL